MRVSWLFSLLLFSAAAPAAQAEDDARIAALLGSSRNWDQVEAIVASATAMRPPAVAGVYPGKSETLYLSPDGRMASVINSDAWEGMQLDAPVQDTASIGRWQVDGMWLTVKQESFANGSLENVSAELIEGFRKQLSAQYPGLDESAAIEAYRKDEAKYEADVMSDPSEYSDHLGRALMIENAEGTLLVAEETLLFQAQRWDGEGALNLDPNYWRASNATSRYAKPMAEDATFAINDPMHASVPWELRKLLRREVVEARVLGRVDPEKPIAWGNHRATLELALDRGEDAGLFAGMTLYGAVPNEDLYATVKTLTKDTAVVTTDITRFAPDDKPAVPDAGVVLASRTQRAIGCGIDDSAGVRARITAVRQPAGGVQRDADGYAFVEVDIDQGSYHGLLMNAEFSLETEQDAAGEGRVRALRDTSSTVLWRAEPQWFADEDDVAPTAISLPNVGDHLVTPSWKRYENEVFGKKPAMLESKI